jgi:formylglycine-generating enzyme required for sulfatase activity
MGSDEAGPDVVSTYNRELKKLEDEHPAHEVTISKPFYLATTEVTQRQFQNVMGYNPSRATSGRQHDDHPVDSVTWIAAVEFCEVLSALDDEKAAGRIYTLPTEAEWEYACRANTQTQYSFGDDPKELSYYAWCRDNAGQGTQAVGMFPPNGFGLYDMEGNVSEWCLDRYSDTAYSESPEIDPQGPNVGLRRVYRGGAWCLGPFEARASIRNHMEPSKRSPSVGFRVVCRILPPSSSGFFSTESPQSGGDRNE